MRYRNTLNPVIPERVITRAPSAELRENQTDQASLPDYARLDCIIQHQLGELRGPIDAPQDEISHVVRLIHRNEYKRVQAPLGPKISVRAFGRDWRMPVMGAAS